MLQIEQGDALVFLRSLEPQSVDVVLTDPPYFKVKGEAWDNAWADDEGFLLWLESVVVELERVLRSNGSFFLFCSPRLSARVECVVARHLNVLNSLVWYKPPHKTRAYGCDRSKLRSFFDDSERIIFAEPRRSDATAKGEAGYLAACDKVRGFVFEPLRAYLAGERSRSGLKGRQIQEGMFQRTGKRYVLERHAFSRSQWELPTQGQYEAFRDLLNEEGEQPDSYLKREYSYLKREYSYLKREYEDLKREYEDLKREYEDLRRHFDVAGDENFRAVWEFPPCPPRRGKHPCEKPLPLLHHILSSCARPSSVVLDPFVGSGATAEAAISLGHSFLGCDLSSRWVREATERASDTAKGSAIKEPNPIHPIHPIHPVTCPAHDEPMKNQLSLSL